MEQIQTAHHAGFLWSGLAAVAQHLEAEPDEAESQLLALLKIAPGQPQALQLLIDAKRAGGDLAGARALLEQMATELPAIAAVHYELGLLLDAMGEKEAAARSLSLVIELEPMHPQAWRALGDVLVQLGETEKAADAYLRQYGSSITDLKMLEQVGAPDFEQREIAEDILHEYLGIYATDLNALETLGKIYLQASEFESAEKMFRRALELVPSFRSARLGCISALRQQLRPGDEIKEIDILLEEQPDDPEYRVLKAVALSESGRIEEAISYSEELLAAFPELPKGWIAYAHALRVAGRQKDCIAAYKKVLELDPQFGQAWWGLANLKIFRFEPSDVEEMRAQLARENVSDENREFLHFALGEALEDLHAYQESFGQYDAGNKLVRKQNPYNIEKVLEQVPRAKQWFTREFFSARAGQGCPSRDPIFILGLPRSGSTLIEQILASHSSVEGTGELLSLIALIRKIEETAKADEEQPDDSLDSKLFRGQDPRALGEEYLERCRPYRKLNRQHFTDKLPTNFRHVGLIATILPNAKIIDARRHPLACCFSNFKQIFPSLKGPSYDLQDIGRYYRAYVELLAHFDRVLPGRIHRVVYEEMVANPETEIRRLLDYCELPFQEQCLRFYETERGIRTISSEQVRQPLYTDSVGRWRHFEPWLGPLKAALGSVLDAYPAIPEGI
jgi:tetratricopeptide (TPR) repeat protein